MITTNEDILDKREIDCGMKRKTIYQAIILLSILALCFFTFFHYHLYTFFLDREKAITFIKSFGPWSVLVFISFQILQVILAPIPGEVTGVIGGYLYGPILGTLYSTIGLALGSWLAFSLAHIFGESLVEKIVKLETLRKYDSFLEHKGRLVIFILFLIPGFPKDALSYILGLSHMRALSFIIISTAGRFLGTVSLSVIGSLAQARQYKGLGIVLILCGIIVLAAYMNRERLMHILKKGH
jgi:uncharacterized membrane protein YdjX (TVP38/TMEM64 family)